MFFHFGVEKTIQAAAVLPRSEPNRRMATREVGLVAAVWPLLLAQCFSQHAGNDAAESSRFRLLVVDAADQPVAGAQVGLTCQVGKRADEIIAEEHLGTEWLYYDHQKTDANGHADVELETRLLGRSCLVARDERRSTMAIVDIDPKQVPDFVRVKLAPERQVLATVTSEELARRHRELGPLSITVRYKGKTAVEFECPDSNVRFVAPGGDYEIEAKAGWTYASRRRLTVNDENGPQPLGSIDLPALRMIMLEGQSAPEFVDVAAWKNSEPLALAELRGRCVLLDFWAYWCGPCNYQMPKLFELHDKYHGKGLTIVGIHCDVAESTEGPVVSVDALDRHLADVRASVWGGRDIPFPVAILTPKTTPFGGRVEGSTHGVFLAAYGVRPVPQLVLIDRRGKVAGRFDPSDKDQITLLEGLLEID